MTDAGLTHVAIEVSDLQRSIDFYADYGEFDVVHRRDRIAWISDRTRPFALVLAEREPVSPLGPFAHLGFACRDRGRFDELVDRARGEGRLRIGPEGDDGPAGTWAFLDDPDGNTFELSVGQSVAIAVSDDRSAAGPRKRPIVGVMGSGDDDHRHLAEPLGEAIARAGWHLLTGGGGGVMEAAGRGFTHAHPRAGSNLGVLRGDADGRLLPGYPNRYVELPVSTHLPAGELEPDSRNHINILSSDAVVALPGRVGTRAEIELARRYGRSIVVHETWGDEFPSLPCFGTISRAMAFLHETLAQAGEERPDADRRL